MSDEALVLCLYAGGTIGMVRQDANSGFAPYPSFLTETLRSQSRFHDPYSDSIFSWSDSVDRYKAWSELNTGSSSGASTPIKKPWDKPQVQESIKRASLAFKDGDRFRTSNTQTQHQSLYSDSSAGLRNTPGLPSMGSISDQPTAPTVGAPPFGYPVLVRSSAPKGTSTHHAINSQFSGNGKHLELELPTLITPRGANGKRVRYAVLEYDPLLDSSEMDIPDWIRLASDISLNYQAFDSFIVFHGTDTMAYTSSALSMLLENLGKSVIVTGAQVPLSELRNDAIENVLGALMVAGTCIIPEVCLYFASSLFRGNRTSKVSNNALAAFDSPNMPPLAKVGINIEVSWNLVERSRHVSPFRAHDSMSSNVAVLRLFPGLPTSTVKAFLSFPLQGMVLESYGAGNAPSRKDLLDVFKEASDRGVVIVNITQCTQGEVSAIYAVGKKLEAVGVVAGGDMTPECALAKLSYLLGKNDLAPAQIRQLMARPLRGELTPTRKPAPHMVSQNDSQSSPGLSTNTDIKTLLAHILQNPTKISFESQSAAANSGHLQVQSAAAWDRSDQEVSQAATAVLPYTIYEAASKGDLPLLRWHLSALSQLEAIPSLSLSSDDASKTVRTPDPPLERLRPLHIASAKGFYDVVECLLQAGCSVHARDTCSGHSPLFLAAKNGHMQVVKLLKTAGAHLKDDEIALAKVLNDKKLTEATAAVWTEAGLR